MSRDVPKMTRAQAKILWRSMTPQQKLEFNKMYEKFLKQELKLAEVNVDDNNQIANIVLENKDAPSKPSEPFYKHFDLKD